MKDRPDTNATVLIWPGPVLSEGDLRRYWTSQREVVVGVKTIVTPLAQDWLRGKRVSVRREERRGDIGMSLASKAAWGCAQERPSALVEAAIRAMRHEGRGMVTLESPRGNLVHWVRDTCQRVVQGEPPGAMMFCEQPGLVVCVANKVRGVRAAAVSLPVEMGGLQKALGPNVVAVAPAGRTYFELRQLVKLATSIGPACPTEIARDLQELDSHAHR